MRRIRPSRYPLSCRHLPPSRAEDRAIGSVPSYITGPASNACGGCHRAQMINEDNPGELIPFLQHTKNGGYLIDAGSDARGNLMQVMQQVTAQFQ